MPDDRGVYLLSEQSRTLYIHGTKHLRGDVERHRKVDFRGAFANSIWTPDPDNLFVAYAVTPTSELMKQVESRLIRERKPLFNIPRAA
ncbi:MAG: hypothetical protein N2C14_24875 [Planctomycetales bacterium]